MAGGWQSELEAESTASLKTEDKAMSIGENTRIHSEEDK